MRRGDARSVVRPLAASAPRSLVALAKVLAGGFVAGIAGCAPPLRMCAAAVDCGALSSCVAGRCVAHGSVPAIAASRRMLYDPVEVGYVRRGGAPAERGPGTNPPVVVTLGHDGALAFLRFSVPLAPEVNVVEAYLLLDRVRAVDADPVPIVLHAARIVDRWDALSLSWGTQPRVEEIGAPTTRVLPAAGGVVRIDVRALVDDWRHRRANELGVAVVSDVESPTGMAFALSPEDAAAGASGTAWRAPSTRSIGGPRLELYLR